MNYISIRVATLRGDQKISFNAYIKINDKMVLYLKKGDSFEGNRLQKLKDKKLRKMFIVTDEEANYIDYLDYNINMAYDNKSNVDIQTRAEIIQGDQQSKTEEVFEDVDNVESYNLAKEAAGKYVDFILSNDLALSSIMNINNIENSIDQKISHHSIAVATLSIALANKLGITNSKQTQLLTMGALLHDFGHFESTIDYTKAVKKMRPLEVSFYLGHPATGAQKVRNKKHFDEAVINIIEQHEELIDGSGPGKLLEKQTDPLALIVSSCNAIDRLITYQDVNKSEAVLVSQMDAPGTHPKAHYKFLEEILKNS